MDGFKNITIENFRGIKRLEMEDFSRVNVLLGQNSSGKSSVLECLLLAMGMSNPDLPQTINAIRSRSYSVFADLSYIFPHLDITATPQISADLCDGTKRRLTLGMTYVFDGGSQPEGLPNGQIPTSGTKVFLNTLKMAFQIEGNQEKREFGCSLTVNQAGVVAQKKVAEGYLEKNSVAFLHADLSAGHLAADLVELAKRKKKDTVVALLHKFDSRIVNVEILNNAAYVELDGTDQLLSVNMMGDGLRRYLNIVAAAANPQNNIILIDEIDNGLHYSAYKKLWEALFSLAVATNKQVFVTTHSKETLRRLNEMLQEHPEFQPEFRMFTIADTPRKGHQAYKYTFEGLQGASENDVEVRGMVYYN